MLKTVMDTVGNAGMACDDKSSAAPVWLMTERKVGGERLPRRGFARMIEGYMGTGQELHHGY